MYSLTHIIQIIIIFQGGLLILFILANSREKFKKDLFLTLLIATLTLQITGMFLMTRDILPTFFKRTNTICLFLYGPLLFFYSKYITFSSFKLTPKNFVHFLPPIAVLTIVVLSKQEINQTYIYLAYTLSIVSYVFLSFLELRKYKRVIMDNYSKLEKLNLKWLQWTLIIFALIVLVDGIQIASFLLYGNAFQLEILVFLLILATINLLYFNGFKRSHVLLSGFNDEDFALSASISTRKRRNTHLLENKLLIQRLETHLRETESFKNPNLTIGLLSNELNIPKRTLSELINDHYDQNFVDFINTYRVNCAKEKLLDPTDPNETVLEVMYDVGFNSKSSFYTAFKKKTGRTPTQYKSN